MSLIKKIDVEKHLAARRAMRHGRTGPLRQASTRVQAAAAAKNTPESLQEDAVAHSSSDATFPSTAIAAGSGAAHGSALPRNRQA